MNKKDKLFPIGMLGQITGVNTRTLRSWEIRYGLLKPSRTAKGHRTYQSTDIDRVNVILSYIKRGVAVSKVKKLLSLQDKGALIMPESTDSKWPDYLEGFIKAAKTFSVHKLNQLYERAISLYPIEVISTRLFLPLLKTYQAHILANCEGAVAEEHFLANYIRNRLAAHFQQLASLTKGSKLVFAALPAERHDFILLLFAIHCMNTGLNVISLGTNTPLKQITFAAEKINADGIVCFGRLSSQDIKVLENSSTTIFNYQHNIQEEIEFQLPEDFAEALTFIKNTIKTKEGVHHG